MKKTKKIVSTIEKRGVKHTIEIVEMTESQNSTGKWHTSNMLLVTIVIVSAFFPETAPHFLKVFELII
jgi:hypothetical protein